MKQYREQAISPVVGVMLMLVVTIIIAAVVSGFAGGMMKGQTKAPQATVQGSFSVTSGLQITHAGGDAIPTSSMVITVKNGPTFGPNLEAMSTNTLNVANLTNSAGTPVAFFNPTTKNIDGYNITSFNPGDTFYMNITNCNPTFFQPTVASSHGTYSYDGTHWSFSSSGDSYWALDFVNPNNVGKQFYMDVNDRATGALISRAVVTITG
jgi:archaeal type IV pilus assembly protein PilA